MDNRASGLCIRNYRLKANYTREVAMEPNQCSPEPQDKKFSPWLQDKIWGWPGDEVMLYMQLVEN